MENSARSRSQVYKESGVDIELGNTLVDRIKNLAGKTHTPGVFSAIGGFSGLFKPDFSDMEEPILVSATDGVGTKLKLAIEFNKHDTIGIDLVAMSVNDLLVQGAKPLFFLDYFACGKLHIDTASAVIQGVAEGCLQSSCALLGGETAEMPGIYAEDDYDLAGFCVGMVDNAKIIDGTTIRPNDVIIGLASSGVHANGYSLVRKLFAQSGLLPTNLLPGTTITMQEALLAPTRIYANTVRSLMRDLPIKGMVHITGGGFYDNIPRILPKSGVANIQLGSWEVPPIFEWLQKEGNLSWPEMLQIFNCGIGYMLIVSPEVAEEILPRCASLGEKAWRIGSISYQAGEDGSDLNHAEQVNILMD